MTKKLCDVKNFVISVNFFFFSLRFGELRRDKIYKCVSVET